MTRVTALTVLICVLLATTGCFKSSRPITWGPHRKLEVAIVPGCPSQDDGSLSPCQWQRAVWAAQLWEDRVVGAFITSGSAVYNPYVEAEALKAGMVALGVPSDRIHTETQALHSDQNAAYALEMVDSLGYRTIGVASHTGHANLLRTLMRSWGARHAVSLELNTVLVMRRMKRGLPEVATAPERDWLPLKERERHRAGERSRRPHSLVMYPVAALASVLGVWRRPLPPGPEPTLSAR
ncbi:MAG: YdcF family protein [Myxococcota bacterium]